MRICANGKGHSAFEILLRGSMAQFLIHRAFSNTDNM
jgi:hypothetical protein